MKRVFFILFCAIVAAVGSYYAQPFAGHNADLILIVVTVFTVFAGFLVGVITILGDPALIPDGSWRVAETRRESIEQRLVVHVWLFVLYLITIGFLFVGVLMQKGVENEIARLWIEHLYLFFGIFSFLLTFGLPVSLMRMQRARVDAEIERRRAVAGISQGESKSGA